MTSRNYVFTINNPTGSEDFSTQPRIKLCLWQLEVGESGCRHFQGYVEFTESLRMAAVKRMPCFARAHLEARKGSRFEAAVYCTKTDGRLDGPWIHGYSGTPAEFIASIEQVGKKKDSARELEAIKSLLDSGASSLDVAEMNFSQWVRHHRAFSQYIMLKTAPRTTIDNVIVVFGPTGTGKSHFCQRFEPAYWKSRGQWWDGYNGHSNIIIDEFYGWLPWDMLLRVCDKYPLLLETKGGTVQFVGTTIVFTTNKDPTLWYDQEKGMLFETFARRVTEWIYMPEKGVSLLCKTALRFATLIKDLDSRSNLDYLMAEDAFKAKYN